MPSDTSALNVTVTCRTRTRQPGLRTHDGAHAAAAPEPADARKCRDTCSCALLRNALVPVAWLQLVPTHQTTSTTTTS